jgi:elongation factor Ts
LAESFANLALKHLPTTKEELLNLQYEDGLTIAAKVEEQTGVIGEKLELSEYAKIETSAGQGQVLPYIHMGYKAGVVVALNKEGPMFEEAGKNVAMQVAAMKPVAVDENGVSKEVIEKELEIGMEIARKEGKPEAMLEKIAKGKLNKYFRENTLLNQAYVKENKKSVAQYLKDIDPELTVTDFKHIKLG